MTQTTTSDVGAEIAPTTPDSNRDKTYRPYVVLQDTNLALVLDGLFPEDFAGELSQEMWDRLEAVSLYMHIGTVEARNTEHALQQAGVKAEGSRPTLVPIAKRHFRAETITVDRSPRVVVG